MGLIFCYAVYNEAATLEESLKSIQPYADRIVVVDGWFKDAPLAHADRVFNRLNSTDGTLTIAKRYASEIIKRHDLLEHDQRDFYLKGRQGDYYFIIDGDEVLKGKFPKARILSGEKAVWAIQIKGWGHDQLSLRVYKHTKGCKHNEGQILVDGEGLVMDAAHPGGCGVLAGCWLQHLQRYPGEKR